MQNDLPKLQFLIMDEVLSNVKLNIELTKLKRKFKKFDDTAFVKDVRDVDWSAITETDT